MSVKKKKPPCALCNQPVKTNGFELVTQDGTLSFCCEGCLSIYQLLNNNKLITDNIHPKNKR